MRFIESGSTGEAVTDDLKNFRADSSLMLRLALTLGVTALLMFSVTLWRVAGGDLPEQRDAAPQAVSTSLLPLEPAVSAPTYKWVPYERCPKYQKGIKLKSEIAHQRKNTDGSGGDYVISCYYGTVQILAGDVML
jgi:hypothetical protein